MNLSVMSSINTYTKALKLQTQWNIKQKNGDYTSHKKDLADWVNTTKQALKKGQLGLAQDDEEKSKQKMNSIMMKIYNGKKLTEEERRYLRIKNPQAYAKMCFTEQEQKAYERRLKRCRTKEEVQRLTMSTIASSLSTIGAVANNPHISPEKKLEICMQEKVRCDKLQASTRAFVRSGAYSRLPSELEKSRRKKPVIQTKPQQPIIPPEIEKPEDVEKPDDVKPPEPIQPSEPDNSATDAEPAKPNGSTKPENRPAAATPRPDTADAATITPAERRIQRVHAVYATVSRAQPRSAVNIRA